MKGDHRVRLNRSTVTLAAMVLVLGGLLVLRVLMPGAQQVSGSAAGANAGEETPQAQQVAGTGDFFKDFRAQRETARADEIALLDGIVNRQGAPEKSVREADARKIELTRFTEQERAIEKLLVAKGFEDAAAFVQEDTVSIAVKKEKLSEEDTAKILELAMRQTDQPAENIKIIPVAPD